MNVRIRRRGVEYHSRMTQILNVNLTNFFKLMKHIFIIGSSGSGKTSTLLLLADLFYENGETILWRDDTSLEFLSLRDVFPWKVFIPEGCELNYTHPNVEYAYYNPWRLNTIFNQVDRDKGNAVVFDLFSYDMRMFIEFWSRFFYGLYKWKRTKVKQRVALIADEINDLCPGMKRGYIPKQLALSSNIYFSLKKYRKEGVRLVACYDSATRVLTREGGLKDYLSLKVGDHVLSVNPTNRQIEWKPVTQVYIYNYSGKMVHFHGKSFDLLVTPGHQMLIDTRSKLSDAYMDARSSSRWKLKFEDAQKTSKRATFRFPYGIWSGSATPHSNDFFYQLGLYIGDGSIYSDFTIATKSGLRRKEYLAVRDEKGRFCSHGSPSRLSYHRPRVYLYIPPEDKSRKKVEDTLNRLNIKWNNDYRKNIYFSTRSSEKYERIFRECGSNAYSKHVPRRFLDASPEQIDALLQGLIDSDGYNGHVYVTVNEKLAVNVVELATKLGWSATIKHKDGKTVFIKDHLAHSRDYYIVSIKYRPKWKSNDKRKNVNNTTYEDYNGVVWSPEVADNHNLLVERNGRFVFCGNSTHAYGDVHKPVREAFNFYLFRRMDGASVPDRFKRYQKVIERLKVNEMIVVDEAKNFNKMNVDEIVKPKKFSVSWSGDLHRETEVKHKELELWKKRTVLAATVLNKGFGVTYEQLATLLGYKGRTGIHQFMKKKATSQDLVKIEEFLKDLE